MKPIYLGDDLSSRQPTCKAVTAIGAHFLFAAKPSSHTTLGEWLDGADVPAMEQKIKQGKRFVTQRYRWLEKVRLRDGKDALDVNWLEIEIVDATGKTTYHNSFVTGLPVNCDIVAEFAACGRSRWKACPGEGLNREQELQHTEIQGLQPRTQLWPRRGQSGGSSGHHEPAGLRHAHGLREGAK